MSSYYCREFKSSLVRDFELLRAFSLFVNFTKSMWLGFCDRCLGTDCKSVIGWREKCIVFSLFCIFIIIVSSIIINISFVVLLNCLYLNP